MILFEVSREQVPPASRLTTDWFGDEVVPPVLFSLAIDAGDLVFTASREATARCHPEARSGLFQPELWNYDAAEFFLADPVSGKYLECNLSPNGAHWACLFDSPRQVLSELDGLAVRSTGSCGQDCWRACAALPVAWLEEHLHFGSSTRINVAFIIDSPSQRFLTYVPLGGGEPDFHRPGLFSGYSLVKLV